MDLPGLSGPPEPVPPARAAFARPAPGLDAREQVCIDALCIRCGHELRGLHLTGRCPRCLHPVSDSLYGDLLADTDPRIVRQLAEHTRVVRAAMAAVIALTLCAALAATLSARSLEGWLMMAYDCVLAGTMLAPLPAVLGIMLVTSRRTPRYFLARLRRPPKPGARSTAAALARLAAVALAGAGLAALGLPPGLAAGVLWMAVPLAVFGRGLVRLAERLPDRPCAMQARAVLALSMLFAGLHALVLLLRVRAAAAESPPETLLGLSTLGLLIGAALSGFGLRLLRRIEDRLHRAAGAVIV